MNSGTLGFLEFTAPLSCSTVRLKFNPSFPDRPAELGLVYGFEGQILIVSRKNDEFSPFSWAMVITSLCIMCCISYLLIDDIYPNLDKYVSI